MLKKYFDFIRRVSVDLIGKLGVILTTSSFITLILLELARLAGIVTNTYAGLVTYMVFPALFILGLVLIPLGWYRLKKKTGKTTSELMQEKFEAEDTRDGFWGSRLIRTIGFFSAVNVLFLSAISIQMFGFMEKPVFCGTACHSVMNPEWVTYQQSPHARVRCVDCHVGEGVDALIDSKLNGLWQIVSVTFDLLERPIPTPVHQLRPARETCEKCHWPEKFYGSRLLTRGHYKYDENSTPLYTTLNLKIDAVRGTDKTGIHWHIGPENEVRYASVNDKREEMLWVEVLREDGAYERFTNRKTVQSADDKTGIRVLDCVDCHNRATHIYEDPERALDERIRLGQLDRSLPFLKREALHAISNYYPDKAAAFEGIANHMHGFYSRQYPEIARAQARLIDSAVSVLQGVYDRNIHPEMNIIWNTYPSHIGHKGNTGCFRCHNPDLVAASGKTISYDCTLCHSILSSDQIDPFRNLEPADTTARDYYMQQYLKDEFMKSYLD
ncbi:MAG: cytochrome C [Candidatus Zixiibacteriota bacterium]